MRRLLRRLWRTALVQRAWHVVMATDEESERYSRVDDELRRKGL